MHPIESPSDAPPLRRWRVWCAAKWGAGLSLLFGVTKIAQECALLVQGKSAFGLRPGADILLMLVTVVAGAILWGALFMIVALVRNLFLPAEIRQMPDPIAPKVRRARPILGVLWPPAIDAGAPNLVGRLGRVLHWCAVLAGLAIVAIGLATADGDSGSTVLWAAPGFGAAIALAGRAARYILAGE